MTSVYCLVDSPVFTIPHIGVEGEGSVGRVENLKGLGFIIYGERRVLEGDKGFNIF